MSDYRNKLNQSIGHPLPTWEPCAAPMRAPMSGRYCRLEPLNPERHAQQLYQAHQQSRDEDWTYLPYGPYQTYEAYLAWQQSVYTGNDPLFFAVIDQVSDMAVGILSYLRITPAVGVIEVGHIHFSPLLQNKPAATEAIFLTMKHIFDELGYRRFEWKCDAFNAPSRKAALRFGFSYEGIFRQATMYKGHSRDTAWFAIIDKEWPALKQAYETWLSPDNFDTQGRQKSSLSVLSAIALDRD
ncbi:MAG: GNAT family N-acetyltransferase [Candidatus Promineifilaceae bacterium]